MGLKLFECGFGSTGYAGAGAPGGCSVTVYDNGDVIRTEYTAGLEQLAGEMKLANRPELAEKIREIVGRYRADLEDVPDVLGAPWEGGSREWFLFGDKGILTWGIRRIGLSDISLGASVGELEKFRNTNLVMDIFDEIAREINESHVGVVLGPQGIRMEERLERLIRQNIVRKTEGYHPDSGQEDPARPQKREERRITDRNGSIRGFRPK